MPDAGEAVSNGNIEEETAVMDPGIIKAVIQATDWTLNKNRLTPLISILRERGVFGHR